MNPSRHRVEPNPSVAAAHTLDLGWLLVCSYRYPDPSIVGSFSHILPDMDDPGRFSALNQRNHLVVARQSLHEFLDVLGAAAGHDEHGVRRVHDHQVLDAHRGDEAVPPMDECALRFDGEMCRADDDIAVVVALHQGGEGTPVAHVVPAWIARYGDKRLKFLHDPDI